MTTSDTGTKSCLRRSYDRYEHEGADLIAESREWCSNCRLLWDSLFVVTVIGDLTIEEGMRQYPCVRMMIGW